MGESTRFESEFVCFWENCGFIYFLGKIFRFSFVFFLG